LGLTTSAAPDALLVTATAPGGASALFVADIGAATVTAADEFDPGRGLIEVTFDRTSARLVVGPPKAAGAIAAAYRRALLAVGAEQLGVARACLEMTVDYAKTRNQFGAPIGSFQAIKHRCAGVLLDTELADATVRQAVDTGALADAELAFIVATRAAVSAAESCIHVHGGIGFTWEHSAHWYLRRARVNANLLGSPGVHRSAIAESAGLPISKGE
jgi:alkylation response protein AidB-like acyl-CoA dehydrogenase